MQPKKHNPPRGVSLLGFLSVVLQAFLSRPPRKFKQMHDKKSPTRKFLSRPPRKFKQRSLIRKAKYKTSPTARRQKGITPKGDPESAAVLLATQCATPKGHTGAHGAPKGGHAAPKGAFSANRVV